MILGKKWIKLALRLGWIHCEPAPTKITEVSFNVTLGQYVWKLANDITFIYPEDDARDYYSLIDISHPTYFKALPGRMYIGHTQEFCGSTVPFITSSIRTRSTFRRWGMDIAMAAGMGEPGYHSRWALELHNSHHVPVYIGLGWEIGQLSFSWVTGGSTYKRAYNVPESEWTPEALLPKPMT